ncbi:DUF2252 domain-containing protein [Candidatus Chloroploca asiatica]|uniref:DUF2252 domain-containing protein n=1 Tax=Candidatus Chloroploca asiatica TaxID=1506545 RepID=UPI001C0ECF65|nr:DUF2252 domain-containing protein [Candidatus Chloroploca asiatica]
MPESLVSQEASGASMHVIITPALPETSTTPSPPRLRHPTVAQREEQGRAARERASRSAHARWKPSADRLDPVALLEAQTPARLPELVPLRYGRMLASPFAFLRGSAIVMAHDLARTPNSGITVQLCGDCHLSNFGVYASPERALLFDLNDFDETLPGPFEWDVKRLATSFVVAARSNDFSARQSRRAAQVAVLSYRETMRRFAEMRELELWYHRIEATQLLEMLDQIVSGRAAKMAKTDMAKARRKDSLQALDKLTTFVDGQRRFISDPPLLVPLSSGSHEERIREEFRTYRESLQDDRHDLLMRYRVADIARKVVGVGSVGTRAYVILLLGRDANDPLLLQVKQANHSVLEPHLAPSRYANQGQRVIAGQRLLQAASDIFLGWNTGADGNDYYWRQLRDMKGSAEVSMLGPDGLQLYAAICGGALARAHARSGDRITIAAYMGKGEAFDEAITAFAERYADQTERDHEALAAAVKEGRIVAA